ncbi:hypothetical protein B0H19DRAFT_1081354 [Mycena capillaripes]|nr:hypothetical protein B0H19DRAFT_1081354 [Mycena capillaripes]
MYELRSTLSNPIQLAQDRCHTETSASQEFDKPKPDAQIVLPSSSEHVVKEPEAAFDPNSESAMRNIRQGITQSGKDLRVIASKTTRSCPKWRDEVTVELPLGHEAQNGNHFLAIRKFAKHGVAIWDTIDHGPTFNILKNEGMLLSIGVHRNTIGTLARVTDMFNLNSVMASAPSSFRPEPPKD